MKYQRAVQLVSNKSEERW